MAAEFLRTHGIDIDAEMQQIQSEYKHTMVVPGNASVKARGVKTITNASLPRTPPGSLWALGIDGRFGTIFDIHQQTGRSEEVRSEDKDEHIDARGALVAPSLCHPHLHLDKAYLLAHPKYADLQIQRGDFAEAMELTGKAKARFEEDDLLERGQRVIDESVAAGVTHMRCFVELDAGVGTKCLDAGMDLKHATEDAKRCKTQICAFAQLPLFSPSPADSEGNVIRGLMESAAQFGDVEALGSTPYVESDRKKMERNVEWTVDLALKHHKHLDFHLDYNLDSATEPLIWHVVHTLLDRRWMTNNADRTIVIGHCTRSTLFDVDTWRQLKDMIGKLPIHFVGLPTSDLFMMRTDNKPEIRGTLDVPTLIKEYGLNACLGINNIGNAFTPHGSCDPLTLACNGVGIYQSGTQADAELLYECVSTRARRAIGLKHAENDNKEDLSLQVQQHDEGSLLVFGAEEVEWRTRKRVCEAVWMYDHCQGRRAVLDGNLVS